MTNRIFQPDLSVCIANYNHGAYLPETLDAILSQSHRPAELIIVDDGSTDDSVAIIERHTRKNPVVRLVRNDRNRGVLYSANRALSLANGHYICFLSADDPILEGYFQKSLSLLAEYPNAGMCSGISSLIGSNGEPKGLFPIPAVSSIKTYLDPHQCLMALRRHGSWIMGNTVIAQRQALINAGAFDPRLHSLCDGFAHMVIALRHGACFIPEPLACWRRMDIGFSQTVGSNIPLMLDIRDEAVRLMRGRYRDLFPTDFVDNWARISSYHAATVAVRSGQFDEGQFFAKTFPRLWPFDSWRGRLIKRSRRILREAPMPIKKLVLFVTLMDLPSWIYQKWWRTLRRPYR